MSVNTRNSIITNGLVTYLDALNSISYVSGSQNWNDILKINSGTLVSASYNTDAGGSLVFSGSNVFVTMSSEFNLTNWTYNGWYRYDYEPLKTIILNPLVSSGAKSGQITWDRPIFQNISSLSFDTTGSIYFGTFGSGVWDNTPRWFGLKLDSTGSLDTAFDINYSVGSSVNQHQTYIGDDGFLYTSGTNLNFFAKRDKQTGALISQVSSGATTVNAYFIIDESQRKVYHMGNYTTAFGLSRNYLCKFDLDTYEVDTVFDTGGGLNSNPTTGQIFLTSDKYLYAVGGNISSYKGTPINHIVKLDQSGSLDPNFNPGVGFNDSREVLCALDFQDRLVCIGRFFTSYSGSACNRIVRINPNGTLDTTFNSGTGLNVRTTLSSGRISIQPDNKILITGAITGYSGSVINNIVRINEDGTLDTTFDTGTGLSSSTSNLINYIKPNGDILLGYGYINTTLSYNGTPFKTFILLDSSGSIVSGFNTGSGFTDSTSRNDIDIRVRNTSGVLTTVTVLAWPTLGSRQSPDFYRQYFNRWNNLTITKDESNTLRFYNNGVLNRTFPLSTSSYQNLDLQVDRLSNDGNTAINMIYNRVLTDEEIIQNYNATKGRFGL